MKATILSVLAAMLIAPAAPARPDSPTPKAPLAAFDGLWRGPATIVLPDGARTLVQTERVGPALGGAIRVIEGRSYMPDGRDAGFNAFGIVSPAPAGGYEFRAYAQGRAGTFPMTATDASFEWAMPAGPEAVVRYSSTVTNGKWHEEGWYERDGKRLRKVFDMTLVRVGGTGWPAGQPVGVK